MDMRLYRMELYKLLYKKIFRFGLLAVLGILLAYFLLVSVGGERTTINGELYTGFAAVREDRRITERFRGVLTDEKARQIIEQYGFPSKVEENYGGFRDENYLNGFVTEQLGNGYYFSWDDYQISTALQPLAESGLGAAFHTAVLTLAAWAAPLLLRILFGGAGYFWACGTPMFLVMTGVLTEWYSVFFLPAGIAVCILAASTLSGWNTWRKSEADV